MPRQVFSFLAVVLLVSIALSSPAQQVVADIPLSAVPSGIGVDPFNNRIYVAVNDFAAGTAALAVIDGKTDTVVTMVPVSPGARLVAINVVTRRVYVAGCNFTQFPVLCDLSVVDGNRNKLLTTIPISSNAGIGLQGLAVNPVTDRIYVSDADALQIDVINGASNKIVMSISLGGQQPLGLAVDFVRNRLVAVINGPLIAIIDGGNNNILQRVFVGQENFNVAVNPVIERAYVTNQTFAPSTLGVVDTEDFNVVTNIPVGNNPFGVAADLISGIVFVTNLNDSTISVINGRTNQVVATVPVFGRLIDVNPVTGLAYASDDFSQTVHVISER
ncbi:MAG TPA: YncE family protein [Candidatus Angelobacter sp.]